jgi:hypothetical protein
LLIIVLLDNAVRRETRLGRSDRALQWRDQAADVGG